MAAISISDAPWLRREIGKSHILALDSLRGFSAVLVLAAHLHVAPFVCGYIGVSVFFVISGFLITWLLLQENNHTGTISLKAFYARRTLRIFPAFYVYWVACVVANRQIHAAIDSKEIAFSFFYLGDYYYGGLRYLWSGAAPIMGITWSLGVEEKFGSSGESVGNLGSQGRG